MLKIDKTYIERNGGLLHSIRKKSNRYIRALLEEKGCIKPMDFNLAKLDRTIVHTDPHLDEYFADLIFRSVLPDRKLDIDFMEMSIHSKTNDATCKAYWSNAAVLGIGGSVAGGSKPLLIVDEHLKGGKRMDGSCSQMVVSKTLYPDIPVSIQQILTEVNDIDSHGKAHSQHIGNIIKTAHDVRLRTSNVHNGGNITYDWMNPEWKKTLMDAMITSIIYCLERRIDLYGNPGSKGTLIKNSFNYFIECSPQSDDPFFKVTTDRIKNLYTNQKIVFDDLKIKKEKNSGQLLILGRVCFALEKCWGETIAKIIMMHIWEVLYFGQLCFDKVSFDLKSFLEKDGKFKNEYGEFEKRTVRANHSSRKHDIWIIKVDQNPSLIKGNRPILNLINNHNKGQGIFLMNNGFQCTKTIFKCQEVSQSQWELLVDTIVTLEPDCWYVYHTEEGSYVSNILNGNKSHRYLKQSSITINQIEQIVNTFL